MQYTSGRAITSTVAKLQQSIEAEDFLLEKLAILKGNVLTLLIYSYFIPNTL